MAMTTKAPRRGREKTKDDPAVTRTLDRGLAILEVLAEATELSLSDLARRVEITPTTASRLLATLKRRSFVTQTDTGLFQVGTKALTVGAAVMRSYRLDQVSIPSMMRLSDELGETISLGIRDGDSLIYIEQVEGRSAVHARVRIGRRMPLYATAGGKVLLSNYWESALDNIIGKGPFPALTAQTKIERAAILNEVSFARRNGWALDNEEYEENLCCAAAPIRDRHNEIVAALCVSRLAVKSPCKELEAVAPAIIQAAEGVSVKLGWQPIVPRNASASKIFRD